MGSKLELIGINERNGLVTPNLYKQNWLIPSNTTNNYGVLHTRALSDTTTPIYGKGTGKFLDTSNGGGSYDINGSINHAGSGRLNAISINTAQWSYGPATPYTVVNTRALSDTATPVYGKGTGKFLDTSNGGGDYDINGNVNYIGSGRLNAIGINTAQWSYGPATPYEVKNTRALSDTTTPIYGKGTGKFLDTDNGGGSYDINGNQSNFPGSGRVPLMNNNYAIWSFGKPDPQNYQEKHPHALRPSIIPTANDKLLAGDVHGKGNLNNTILDATNEYVLDAHTDYAGGSWDDIISRDRNIEKFGNYFWVNVNKPLDKTNWYTVNHTRAKSDSTTPSNGKGTNSFTLLDWSNEYILPAHTNYGGGSADDIAARNSNIKNPFNLYWVDSTTPSSKDTWYTVSHVNAKAPTTTPNASDILTSEGSLSGDTKGKGTGDVMGLDFTLAAHTNYAGGSTDDIISRKRNIEKFGNQYQVNSSEYDISHVNAKADGDTKGKGTGDGISLDGTYAAHTNYSGGSSVDISGNQSKFPGSGRNASNKSNETNVQPTITITKGVVLIVGTSKPFGYGFTTGKDYITTKPECSDANNTTNVGTIKWP